MKLAVRTFVPLMLILLAAIAVAACGDDDDGGATGTPAATTAGDEGTPEPTDGEEPDPSMPGAAGIPSNERVIAGDYVLDDGLAMFAERSADEDRTGVTDDSIKVCQPVTLTGQAAFYGGPVAVMDGLVEMINAAGGIHGRTIELVRRDDGGTPAQANQVVRELVENEECFMLFGHVSGPGVFAGVQDYVESAGIPNFMMGESGSYIGEPPKERVWTGVNPATGGFLAFGNFIYAQNPDETLSIVYVDDAYGQSGVEGLEIAADQNGATIVNTIGTGAGRTDYNGEIGQALEGDPTGVVTMGYISDLPKMVTSIRETYGSDVRIYDPGGNVILSAEALGDLIDGIISFNFSSIRETETDNEMVAAVNQILTDDGQFPQHFALALGSVWIEHLTRALECAGPDLTREGFTEAVDGGCFDGSWTCATCLGPTIMNKYDHWPIETIAGQQWDNAAGNWVQIGDTVRFETSYGESVRGNIEGLDCGADAECPWEEGCTPDSADRCLFRAVFED